MTKKEKDEIKTSVYRQLKVFALIEDARFHNEISREEYMTLLEERAPFALYLARSVNNSLHHLNKET